MTILFISTALSNKTLALLQQWKWNYMVGIKSNRVFNGYMAGFQRVSIPLSNFLLPTEGRVLSLRGIGIHRCFARFSTTSRRRYWCTNHTTMSTKQWNNLKRISFSIETMHRTLKQYCLLQRCQATRTDIQASYIAVSWCAFVKTEVLRHKKRISPEESHRRLYRRAIKLFRGGDKRANLLLSHNAVFSLQ